MDILVKSFPPPGTQALFDWTSGLIFLNCDETTYQSYLKGGIHTNPAEAHTVTHEHVHLMQAASCGFMNLWIRQLLPLLGRAMNELGLPKESMKETKDILRNAGKRLSDETIGAIEAHWNILDEKGPLGLTVSTIFESHALFVQLHQHVGPWNEDMILRIVEKFSPDLEYQYAYDIARHFLLDAAFRVFHPICMTSLCCTSPTDAFVALCRELRKRELVGVGERLDCDAFLRLARDLLGDSLIGTAADLGPAPQPHPIYSKFGAGTKLGALSFPEAARTFDNPSGLLEMAIEELDAPSVLRPSEDGMLVRSGRTPDGRMRYDEKDITLAFLVSAINARIPVSRRGWMQEARANARCRWFQNHEKGIIVLKIARHEDPAPTAARIADLLSSDPDPNADPPMLSRTWGRYILQWDIPPGTGLGCDPIMRSFVTSLVERAPWFPLHLCMDPVHHAPFITWFGSLASPDAWTGTRFTLTHPSVIEALVKGIDACFRRGQEIGQDPSAQVVAMTSPYKERMAARLLAGCKYWQEQLGRIIFELDFIANNARAVEISLGHDTINLKVIARALALIGDVKHIFDPPEINRATLGMILGRLKHGFSALVIDRHRSKLLSDFGHDWASFCMAPETMNFVSSDYEISLEDDNTALGFLAILRPGPHLDERTDAFELLAIMAPEVEKLERLGACSFQRVDTNRIEVA
ncbi:hypothetical protein V1277_002829 [Bradyrhizobium sp. AZCC 1588]|uniref:hypothetical protein n=1 Tax=unclassified Bradyrhizobium TaxID=2631580 RepID=UPI002FF37057